MLEIIKRLEGAHRSLMEEYIEVINSTSKLPFLVDIFSLKSFDFNISTNSNVQKFIIAISYIPRLVIKLFCWKPFVTFFVESHIKSKLEEIRASYVQFSQIISPSIKASKEYQWLIDSEKSLKEFSDTLSSWKNMNGIGFIIINLIAGIYGVRTIYELFPQLQKLSPSNVMTFTETFGVSVTNFFTFLLIILILPFWAKRFLFNPELSKNIYQTENIIFEIVQKAKKLEMPTDYLLLLVYTTIYPILIILLASWVATQGFSIPIQFKNTDILLLTWFLAQYILPILVISLFIFVLWKIRKWR